MTEHTYSISPDLVRAAYEAGLAAPAPGPELCARLGVLLQDFQPIGTTALDDHDVA